MYVHTIWQEEHHVTLLRSAVDFDHIALMSIKSKVDCNQGREMQGATLLMRGAYPMSGGREGVCLREG